MQSRRAPPRCRARSTASPSWRAPRRTCRSSTGRSTRSSASSWRPGTSSSRSTTKSGGGSTGRTSSTRSRTAPTRTNGSNSARVAPEASRPTSSGRASRSGSRKRILQLVEQGEVELSASWPRTGWAFRSIGRGAHGRGARGASHTPGFRYSEQDEDLLAFVGRHVGAALSRARAIEETRQRNAELALINSVQEALAGELEMQAIYDVVGDKIQEIFDAQVVDISISTRRRAAALHSTSSSAVSGFGRAVPLSSGFMRHVLETGSQC